MASETSSVLEMEDADMEALSAEDDPPLMMQPGHDIAVKVDAPMKQLSTLETFVTYRVRCVCARWPPQPPVRRRYNHFKLLHKRLSSSHAWIPVPPPPPLHTARQQLDRYSPGFVAIRTRALNAFLDRIVKHPIFTHSEDLKIFLTTADEEFEKIFKSENSAMNLWGLSSALYGTGETKPQANGARVKDPEWSSHLEYLQSLEQKLNTLCTLTTKLYKGAASVASERANLQRVCSSWSTSAGGALGRAAGAVGAGAGGAALGVPPPVEQRARLPLLAAYTAAVAKTVLTRQQAHATYIADPNPTGELHNKLEQASEALRSELADWLPTTRAEIKALLLLTAERQVSHYARTLSSWESARARLEPTPVFETVSRAAAINLSPSKYCNLAEDAMILQGDHSERENSASGGDNSVSASRNTENSVGAGENSASGGKNSVSASKNSKYSANALENSASGGENSDSVIENSFTASKNSANSLENSASGGANSVSTSKHSENNSTTSLENTVSVAESISTSKHSENSAKGEEKSTSGSDNSTKANKNSEISPNANENRTSESKNNDTGDFITVPHAVPSENSSLEYLTRRSDRSSFSELLDDREPAFSDVSASHEPSLELPSDPLREFSDVDLS